MNTYKRLTLAVALIFFAAILPPLPGWSAAPAINDLIVKETPWVDVRAYGAVGDNTTDDTAAIQAALDAAGTATNTTVLIPSGTYKITSKLSVTGTRISIIGTGRFSATLSNAIVANPADPMIEITATHDYVYISGIRFVGNGLTGASGNGHAIAILGTTGDWASYVHIRDCEFESLKGNGKDYAGASMLAAGVYAYGVLGVRVQHSDFVSTQYGVVFDGTTSLPANKLLVSSCTFDTVLKQGIRAAWAENLDVDQNNIFNNVGSGAATDAGIWLENSKVVNITGNRFKNINGNHIAANQSNLSTTLNIFGNYFYSYYATAIVDVGTAVEVANIVGNEILWVNTVTSGVGILISNPAGWSGNSIDISGNRIQLGGGATVSNAIHINNATNPIRGLTIRNNYIGQQTAPSDNQVITNAINLAGAGGISSPTIQGNVILMVAPGVITTAINIGAGTTGAVLMNNVISGATDNVTDAGTKTTEIIAGNWDFLGHGVILHNAADNVVKRVRLNDAGDGLIYEAE